MPEHTLIVNVALSCEIGVALDGLAGIWRGVFFSTVAKLRAWKDVFASCLKEKADPRGACLRTGKNMAGMYSIK